MKIILTKPARIVAVMAPGGSRPSGRAGQGDVHRGPARPPQPDLPEDPMRAKHSSPEVAYITLHYLTLPYLTLPYLTLPYLTFPYLSLAYLILRCSSDLFPCMSDIGDTNKNKNKNKTKTYIYIYS